MIVTTAASETRALTEKAVDLSSKLGIEYYPRRGKSLKTLLETIDPQIFVVNNMRGLSYCELGKSEAFFHPNMAFHRVTRFEKGYCDDSMTAACKLQPGMSFFDGTLGLGADSLVASCVAGESGIVRAVEKSFLIYVLVKEGLKFYAEQHPEWSPIIERISIENADNLDFMRKCEKQSFDVAYFDFMFSRPVTDSSGIQVIRDFASYDAMTEERIREALRIAGKRVVVKSDGTGIRELLDFGFVIEKENQRRNFYYAVLEK
jgi:hypothetical protein